VGDSSQNGGWEGKHIVVTTLGTLKQKLNGGRDKFDLSGLRIIVIDEVDFFFSDKRNAEEIYSFHKNTLSKLT